jgi:hypothetical protein
MRLIATLPPNQVLLSFLHNYIYNSESGDVIEAYRVSFLSRWSRVRCLTLSLQSSPLNASSPVGREFAASPTIITYIIANLSPTKKLIELASSPVGRACLRIL